MPDTDALILIFIALAVSVIHKQLKKIMATLADLKAKVEAEKAVEDSAVTLLVGLNQQLKDALASSDPAAIQALSDELDANTAALAAAVTANTPGQTPTTGAAPTGA